MRRQDQVGFSQRIRLEWLEYTANLMLAGNPRDAIVFALDERLGETLSVGSEVKRGTRHKAISILIRTWVNVPTELRSLRDAGLELLESTDANGRMAIHWCMCMAAYPFLSTVAGVTGRVLRLQDKVGAAQVQRRLREQLGERETVTRAARRILRLFVDWGVLLEADRRGFYRSAAQRPVRTPTLAVWIARAVLASRANQSQSPAVLLRGPHLFPFDVTLPALRELEACDVIEVTRHGVDQDIFLSLADTAHRIAVHDNGPTTH